VTLDSRGLFNSGAEGLGDGAGVLAFEHGVELGGDVEELAVAGLPDLQERTRVEAALDRTAGIQTLLKLLRNEVFLEALATGVLQDSGEPEQLLAVEFGQGIFRVGVRVGHGALKI
jgi:hypothetical protein